MASGVLNEFLTKSTSWFSAVLKCFEEVYVDLGHGSDEQIYQKALEKAFVEQDIKFDAQYIIGKNFRTHQVATGRCDFLVNNEGIIELKALRENVREEDIRQLQLYLIHSGKRIGMCINFPRTYQTSLHVAVIVHSSICPTLPEMKDKGEEWKQFDVILRAKPRKIHDPPRQLGLTLPDLEKN